MQPDLHQIHRLEFQLALEVKKICDKYNIRYFLVAGTLLGAVRHKGFIPWDDDMDIGMLREDYDRFIAVAPDELAKDYFLQTLNTDKGYGFPYAKLRLNGTKFIEKNSADCKAHKGIFIDIFPYDAVPADPVLQKRHSRRIKAYFLMLLTKKGYRFWAAENRVQTAAKFRFLSCLLFMFPAGYFSRKLEQECRRYNSSHSDTVFLACGSYGYEKEQIRRAWIGNLTELEFEGHPFTCPAAWDDYLSFLYGDYMTPPPENKRYNQHSVVEIDLGAYC